jgi:hypothetical protein
MRFLLIFHYTFANATQVSLCETNEEKLENVKNQQIGNQKNDNPAHYTELEYQLKSRLDIL